MAEIGHVSHNDQGLDSQTGSSYASPSSVDILGTELDAQKTGSANFFMCFIAGIGNTAAGDTVKARIHDGSATLTASNYAMDAANTGNTHQNQPFMYITKELVASSAATYALEIAGTGTVATNIRNADSLALNLDDLSTADWAYDEDDVTKTDVGTSAWEDGASITIGNGHDDWLVFVTSHWIADASGDISKTQLDVGGTPRLEFADEMSSTTGEGGWGNITVLKAPATDTTVKVQVRTTGGSNDCDNTRIFALRLNAFEDHFSTYTDGAVGFNGSPTIANNTQDSDIAPTSKTTDTAATRDWCMACGMTLPSCNGDQPMNFRLAKKEGGDAQVTLTGSQGDGVEMWRVHQFGSFPNGASLPMFHVGQATTVADSIVLKAIVDVRCDAYPTTAGDSVDDVGIAAFTWELNSEGRVWINDATTVDAGAVLQDYPGTANWSDTSITVPTEPDTTGLNPPLYVIVENVDGRVASRGVTLGNEGTGTLSGYLPTADGVGEVTKTGSGTLDAPAAEIGTGEGTVTALTRSVQTNMVNLANVAQASLTGLTVLVWETAPPTVSEAPDYFLTNQTTDGSGDTNWVLTGCELNDSDPIWVIVMKDGGTPIGTCRKLTVTAA